jgi:hypothetical protein
VVATELPANTSTSITNMAEFIAVEIIAKHFPHRFEEEKPVQWIEHYPRNEREKTLGLLPFRLVEFSSYKPQKVERFGGPRVKIGRPSWRYVPRQVMEEMVGQPIY